METTIDAAGRIVVPKHIREQAGLEPGSVLEITFKDGHVEIEPHARAVKLVKRGKVRVAVPTTKSQPLTSETVRHAQQALRHRK